MNPRTGILVLGRGHTCHTVKMYYSIKNRLLYPWAKFRQTKYKVMMAIKEESTKIVNFMNLGAVVLVLGHCDIRYTQ